MKNSIPLSFIACAFAFALAAPKSAANGGEQPDLASRIARGWKQTTLMDSAGAISTFDEVLNEQPDARAALLGKAVALLNLPPKSDARLDEAAALMQRVIDTGRTDELAIIAAYQLARLPHVHDQKRDPARAYQLYHDVFRAHPDHYLGQSALLRAATIDLFENWPLEDPATVIDAWAARVDLLKDPSLRRNLLWKLGDAVLRNRLPIARALEFYRAGEALGYSRFDIRSLMLLRVFNLEKELGHYDRARAAARQHLDEFPRHVFSDYLREQLDAMPGARTEAEGVHP